MLYYLKRYEVEYLNYEGKKIIQGIFCCPYHNRFSLSGIELDLVSDIWDRVPSPRQTIFEHGKDVICFFKEYSCEMWDVGLFAEALFRTINEENLCTNSRLVEVQVMVDLDVDNANIIVHEDGYQMILDREYYNDCVKSLSHRRYILDKTTQKV